jgi:hypothetical protein
VVLVLALVAVSATPAEAVWAPERIVQSGSTPRAAAEGADGGVVLLAGDRLAERFSWAPGAPAPVRAVLADRFRSVDSPQRWAVNQRGDVVLVRELGSALSMLAVDASGLRSAVSIDLGPDQVVDEARAVVAADGTGAVAWKQVDERNGVTPRSAVSIRLRPPGASFGPTLDLAAPGPVVNFALRASGDGRIEVAYVAHVEAGNVTLYAELRPGADPPAPEIVATGGEPSLFPVLDVAPGRVLFQLPGGSGDEIAVAAVRTGAASWSAPQTIAPGARTAAIGELPGGETLLAYARGRDVFVTRAPPAAPFGPAARVGHAASRWAVDAVEVSASASGDVVLAWHESMTANDCVSDCVTRVVASVAPAGGQFGPPERVSSLGSIVGWPLTPVAAISSRRESVIAWQDHTGHLVAVRGDARPAPPAPLDRRRPRVRVSTTLARLRAAVHGAPLRVHVSCDEPCAVSVTMWNPRVFWSLYELEPVVFTHAGKKTARWRLSQDELRELRGLLRVGRPTLGARATDGSGNLRSAETYVKH